MSIRNLELIKASELVPLMREASAAQLRAAARAAAEFALEHATVEDPSIDEAMRTLSSGGVATTGLRGALQALVRRLDGQYLDLKDAGEEGRAAPNAYEPAFHRFCAASAVAAALDDDPLEAATEAIYQAHHAANACALVALIERVRRAFRP